MNLPATEIESYLRSELARITGEDAESYNSETVLIGRDRVLDSADLVIFLLAVEDFAAEQLGVRWDWTSDSAMSDTRSVLRTLGSLAAHLASLQPA